MRAGPRTALRRYRPHASRRSDAPRTSRAARLPIDTASATLPGVPDAGFLSAGALAFADRRRQSFEDLLCDLAQQRRHFNRRERRFASFVLRTWRRPRHRLLLG